MIACPACGGLIVLIRADEPYHEAHLQCVECDSTFVTEEGE